MSKRKQMHSEWIAGWLTLKRFVIFCLFRDMSKLLALQLFLLDFAAASFAESGCLNNGHRPQEGLPCICPLGFFGPRCEKYLYSPDTLGCLNNGIRPLGGVPCVCPPGFSGMRCEVSSGDVCSARPCRNNGVKQTLFEHLSSFISNQFYE